MPFEWRPPALTTERLLLRAFHEGDAEPLYPLAANPNITRFTLWEAHRSIEETQAFVRDYALTRYREGMPEPYAVTLLKDPESRPIGAAGCFWVSPPNHIMEVGYWIAEPYWGFSFAGEAVTAVVDLAFSAYDVERVQARVIVGNQASIRVLEKLGFQREGLHRSALFRRGRFEDLLMFSRLRNERR
jgi:ribosomal-protein-alanine N-acetyltransferase